MLHPRHLVLEFASPADHFPDIGRGQTGKRLPHLHGQRIVGKRLLCQVGEQLRPQFGLVCQYLRQPLASFWSPLAPGQQLTVRWHQGLQANVREERVDACLRIESSQRLPKVHRGRSVIHQDATQFVQIDTRDLQHLPGLLRVNRRMLWPQHFQHALGLLPCQRLLAHQAPAALAVVQHDRAVAVRTRCTAQPVGAIGIRPMDLQVTPIETHPATLGDAIVALLEQVDGPGRGLIIRGFEMP
ncbi:hypothetical protein D3C76_665550 [compost metagenome]